MWEGSFSPSASAQNPTYTAPANTSGSNQLVMLTVTASSGTASGVGTATLTVQTAAVAGGNTVTVKTSASPTAVASGGTTVLTASATDSLGHTGLGYQWTDNGAGGNFTPSVTTQNPTYTAPANTSGSPHTVILTASGIDEWQSPWVTGTANVILTVNSMPHTITVAASATPTTVASGGTTTLTASAVDSLNQTGFTWAWSDNGAGGTFSPSATAQNPTYKPAANTTAQAVVRTLTVTVTCSTLATPVSASTSVKLTENSSPALLTVTVTASASATTLASASSTTLTATAADSLGHTGLAWSWSDNGAGGTFRPPRRCRTLPTPRPPTPPAVRAPSP